VDSGVHTGQLLQLQECVANREAGVAGSGGSMETLRTVLSPLL
jgi:hypothetical protein